MPTYRVTLSVSPQPPTLREICLPMTSKKNCHIKFLLRHPEGLQRLYTQHRLISSLKKQQPYTQTCSPPTSGGPGASQPLFSGRDPPAAYVHVTARVGFDRVLSGETALHDFIEACVPDIFGKLQKQKSVSVHSIINTFHHSTLLTQLMIYLMVAKK